MGGRLRRRRRGLQRHAARQRVPERAQYARLLQHVHQPLQVRLQFVFHCDLVLELLCLVHASRTLADLLLGHQHHIGLSLTLLHESLLHPLGLLPSVVSGLGDRPSRCLSPLFIHSTLVTVLLVTSLLELSHRPLLCNASNINLLYRLLAHVLLVLLIVLRLSCFEPFLGIMLFGEHLGLFLLLPLLNLPEVESLDIGRSLLVDISTLRHLDDSVLRKNFGLASFLVRNLDFNIVVSHQLARLLLSIELLREFLDLVTCHLPSLPRGGCVEAILCGLQLFLGVLNDLLLLSCLFHAILDQNSLRLTTPGGLVLSFLECDHSLLVAFSLPLHLALSLLRVPLGDGLQRSKLLQQVESEDLHSLVCLLGLFGPRILTLFLRTSNLTPSLLGSNIGVI